MEINLATVKKVFFVGIGGIGISAIARMMILEGKEVLGSDMSAGEMTSELSELGAKISIGQGFELIPSDTDLIVYTTAIKHYDPALVAKITESGIPSKTYPQMLHIVTAGKYTIAVAGTHGKTTVTAMIAKVLIENKKDPSVIVGSLLKEYKSNLIIGKSEYFVVESCEYERSFLNVKPKIAVITNIEADHLDYYKDLADIENAFAEFVGQTDEYVVCDPSDVAVAVVLGKIAGQNIKIVDYTKYIEKVPKLAVAGIHNRKNAACALAVADILGVGDSDAQSAVAQFTGTWRRLDMKGISKVGVVVVDDYAHHPTEVRAALTALRAVAEGSDSGRQTSTPGRSIVVFQPHLYSRTKAFARDFAAALDIADQVFVLDVYAAREQPLAGVSGASIVEHVTAPVRYLPDFSAVARQVAAAARPGDVVVTMGAGDVTVLGPEIIAALNATAGAPGRPT